MSPSIYLAIAHPYAEIGLKVLLLLPPEERPIGELALRDGADGYVLLNQDGAEVIDACARILDGGMYRPPPADGAPPPEDPG